MNGLDFYHMHPVILLIFTGILGAIVGSFLNVVIYRYPAMLKREWKRECCELLNIPHEKTESFNLYLPRSHCPHCKRMIPFWLNVPLISYLLLRAKCKYCHAPISFQYFLVEFVSAILSIYIVAQFGLSLQTSALLLFTWILIVLTGIDYRDRLLPDTLTLSLLWIGLFISTFNLFVSPANAILGALYGFLFLWIVAHLYKIIRKQIGMGNGDFKMLAMIGAWVGPYALINVILLSSFLALFISAILLCTKKMKINHLIPFGPFLAIGGWYTLLHGVTVTYWIKQWF